MAEQQGGNAATGKGGTVVPGPGHNQGTGDAGNGQGKAVNLKDNPEVRAAISEAVESINKLKDERRAINADIKALREGVVARGINKHALADAERFFNMDKTQRQGYDDSLAIARKALDLPIQPALFEQEGAPPAKH